jgi:hypothetical protein
MADITGRDCMATALSHVSVCKIVMERMMDADHEPSKIELDTLEEHLVAALRDVAMAKVLMTSLDPHVYVNSW